MTHQTVHPLRSRYASKDMKDIFSDDRKFLGWRDCWIALAEAEMDLGIGQIKPEYVRAMRITRDRIDYGRAGEYERKLRHDVMAHIHAWRDILDEECPGAGGIIHLGATSMYVCDNTELLQMREGLDLVIAKTVNVLRRMKPFVEQHMDTPCLGKTHYQTAQPTTYAKRICDWMHSFVLAFDRLKHERQDLKARGAKGTTGTQDSYMKLCGGKAVMIRDLDYRVSKKLGFEGAYPITTQTYPRVIDYLVLSALAAVAISAKKATTDIRLLQGAGEVAEPFRKTQIGSSAMAYKRNPMRSERTGGIARHIITGPLEAAMYASEQWLERTLDDSAERRIVIADTFLGADADLNLMLDIFSPDTEKQNGFRVFPAVAMKHLNEAMPFIVTEEVMMDAVNAGEDRQDIHEIIRQCMVKARDIIDEGGENQMLEFMAEHPKLGITPEKKEVLLDPARYLGTCVEQCRNFLRTVVNPILEEHDDVPEMSGSVKV